MRWWHVSLRVTEEGLRTTDIPLPGNRGEFYLHMNLQTHMLELRLPGATMEQIDLRRGLSAPDFGAELLSGLAGHGVEGDFDRDKSDDPDPLHYNASYAGCYFEAVQRVDGILKAHRASLPGETGQVQLWPHNFDLAFEWFGTRLIVGDDGVKTPAQINFGFAPGDSSHPAPYFYSSPWPLERSMLDQKLRGGARWYQESWEGSLLPYDALVGERDADQRLRAYYRSVFEAAAPSLMASRN
jgi:hypothetical protein